MDSSFASSAMPSEPVGSYFDLVKPIGIPNPTSFHQGSDLDEIFPDQDTIDKNNLPEYLKLFHDAGISDARLKRFTWLHPKNYSASGSLSDDYTLSAYGTSVSSPRGDAWEIVDHGPRKSIDELWDEVFEYQQRIKLLEEVHQAQTAAATQYQDIDFGDDTTTAVTPNGDHHRDVSELNQQQQRSMSLGGEGYFYHHNRGHGSRRWSDYSGGSEMRYSNSMPTSASEEQPSPTLVIFASKTIATLGDTPIVICASTMTQIDKTTVYASKKGVRSDRGSARRLLHQAFSPMAGSHR